MKLAQGCLIVGNGQPWPECSLRCSGDGTMGRGVAAVAGTGLTGHGVTGHRG